MTGHVSDRRLTTRLMKRWEQVKGEGELPSYMKFNGQESLRDIWGSCFVLAVQPGAALSSMRFEYVGKDVVDALGDNPTGQMMSKPIELVPGANITKHTIHCLETREPYMQQGNFVSKSNQVVKYRSCMLPFVGHDGTISHVVVGLSWQKR